MSVRMRRPGGPAAMLAAVLAVVVLAAACERRQAGPPPGVLGITPVLSAALLDDHAGALIRWLRGGRRNATLVHLGENAGLAPLPKDEMERLRAFAGNAGREIDPKSLAASHLAAAARLGIVRRVFWVLPTRDLEHTNAELRIRYLIERMVPGIPRKELDGLRLQGGCVQGTVSGLELAVCGVDTLPPVREPVLMTIDSWFIPRYAFEQGTAPLGGVRKLFRELSSRALQVADLSIISTGRPEDLLRIRSRTMARQLFEGAVDPDLLGPEPPYTWRLTDYASSSLSEGRLADARRALDDAKRDKDGSDPTVRFLRAVALLVGGHAADAGRELVELCGADPAWCPVIDEAAVWLRQRGKPAEAETLLRQGSIPASGAAVTGADQPGMKASPLTRPLPSGERGKDAGGTRL